MQSSRKPFLFFAMVLVLYPVQADEVFEEDHASSVAGMVHLVMLEAELIESLGSYANKLEKKLNILKSALPQLRAESNLAKYQSEEYVSNPVKAFSLIRRMHKDWDDWKIFMEESVGSSEIAFIKLKKSELPSQQDLNEACEGIYRLQDIYKLRTADVSNGLLYGKQYDASLNALDTYELGKLKCKSQEPAKAKEWFSETAKWLIEHTLPTSLGGERAKMLYLFLKAFLTLKYYSIALPVLDHALRIENKTNDFQLLRQRAKFEELARWEPTPSPKPMQDKPYDKGCRGEFVQKSSAKCLYKNKNSPFLRLAPLKAEQVLVDPLMMIYHDVLSPGEILELQDLARPFLSRTSIDHYGKQLKHSWRTSKGTWIHHDTNNLTKRIARRIMDMTELDLEDADLLQVMNYGMGGHYMSHFDYFTAERVKTLKAGNRIATVLFYLTDVDQGGATVFPTVKRAFSPVRGSALFWYNLHSNGTGDYRTLHGGCPVLVGSKWIMTQWIYERSQVFNRPCQ